MNLQEDFPLVQGNGQRIIYLDNSATSHKPRKVIDAMTHFYEKDNANVHRGMHTLSLKATMAYEDAHQTVADFINASFEEIIFTKGTTESLNLLAYSLGKDLKPGDEILLSEMEHHSNIVPWQHLAQEKKAILRFIPLTSDYHLDLEEVQKMINPKTKIVSITHISNVLGTINPVQEIARLAHAVGAIIIVDAAQSVPHMKIDVKKWDCDFLAFSAHKMCGPTGIGVLYGRKKMLENMGSLMYGGGMVKEVTFQKSTWNDLPWKFEAGTPNIAGAIGLAAAIDYLQEIGWENIEAQEKQITRYALERLLKIPGLKLFGPATAESRGPIFSFTIEGVHPHDVVELLDRQRIAVRGGHHCAMPLHTRFNLNGTVRASFYIYNSYEDVDSLVAGIAKVQEKFYNPIEIKHDHI